MTSGTKVSLQSRPSFYSASGGRCWLKTSSGSSEPATSAKFARVVDYIFPLPCQLLVYCSSLLYIDHLPQVADVAF